MEKKFPGWLYLLLRALSIISLLYSLSFIADLLMPLQTSGDILISREHQKHRWHYWVTENFRSPVSEMMYYEFPVGEPVHVQHTRIYHTVFTVSYNTSKGVLIWKRSKLYYFILLLPLFIVYSSYVPLSNRWGQEIGFSAGMTAILFSGVLIFFSRF